MEESREPGKNNETAGIPEERNEQTPSGRVYDVEHRRYHIMVADSRTGRIRIECRCEAGGQEPSTSISVA